MFSLIDAFYASGGDIMNEWFDVVDENDVVIKRELRSVVHAENLLHRAIHILIFNDAGELFLQKRSQLKDQYPGVWGTSCAGHVDSGEHYDEAAYRELREELGIEAPHLEELLYLPACPQTGHEFVKVYKLQHNGPFVLQPEEIDEGMWVSPVVFRQLIKEKPHSMIPSLIHVWQAYERKYL